MEICLTGQDKDWTYLSDVVWQNLVAVAKKRFDKKKHTGEGKILLTALENAVLDVEGINTPAIQGLSVNETWQNYNSRPQPDR